MKITIYIGILIVFFNCKSQTLDNQKLDSQTFVGTYRIMDQLVPYPYIVQQKKDSIYLFDNNGVCKDKIGNSTIKENTEIKFKEKHLKILNRKEDSFLVSDLLDTLNFRTFKNGKNNPINGAKFKKIFPSKKLDIKKIRKEIVSSIWKYNVIGDENSNPNEDLVIEKLLHFKNDSLYALTNYYYQGLKTVSQYETKAYTIFEIDNIYFLSFQKEKDNPQITYQIINYNSKNIELKDFSSRNIKNITFKKQSMSTEDYMTKIKNTSYYANCFDGYQGEYYFGDNVTFNKGNQYIIDYVNNDAPENDTKSGYIIIHFNINCKSNVGRFGLIQMNKEFKQIYFSKEIVNHILNKVEQLKDFPSSYSQLEWLSYKDVHAFLMFKIKKGKIVDLCP